MSMPPSCLTRFDLTLHMARTCFDLLFAREAVEKCLADGENPSLAFVNRGKNDGLIRVRLQMRIIKYINI